MRCCVPSCKNDSRYVSKSQGITFHLFPKQVDHRDAWFEALGMRDWLPSDRSVVCSNHFLDKDFQSNKLGSRRVRNGAVPFVLQEELDVSPAMRMCKICLSLDVKMYHLNSTYKLPTCIIGDLKLSNMYEDITGIPAHSNDTRLPQHVCWECAARLINAANFRAKALFSDGLLHDLLKKSSYIKTHDIVTKYSNHASLKSSLTKDVKIVTIEVKPETIDIPETEVYINETPIKHEEVIVEHLPIVKTEVDLVPTGDIPDEFDDFIPFDVENKDDTNNDVELNDNDTGDDKNDNINNGVENNDNDNIDNDDGNNDNLNIFKVEADPASELATVEEEPMDVKKLDKADVLGTSSKRTQKKFVKAKHPIDEDILTVTPLSVEAQLEEIERRQESARYTLAAYKCQVCYTGYPSKDKYERHAVKHSELSGKLECIVCKIRTKTTRAMRAHMTSSHSEQFSCKLCPLVTRRRNVALEHMKFHAGKKYECPQCQTVFEKKTSLLNHLRMKHLSGFVCSLCGYTFVNMKGVLVHKRMIHPLIDKHIELEGPYCDVCDVKFLCKKAYDTHLKLSSKHIESEDDPNRISNNPSVKNRLSVTRRKPERRADIRPRDPYSRMLNPTDTVDCEQCGVQLGSLYEYSAHFKAAHPGIHRTKYAYIKNPYMCEQCGKMFQSSTFLENHKWVHTGKKKYQCDHCQKTFSVKTNLVAHMLVHVATRRSFPCRECGKKYSSSFNRTRHMLRHAGLKPFKCDACEKCFVTSEELRAHVDYVHLKKPRPKRVRRKPRKCDTNVIEY